MSDATLARGPAPESSIGPVSSALEGRQPDGRRRVLDGHREPDADEDPLLGRVQDARHDADHLAVHRHQRPAGVARVGRGVELDEIRQEALAVAASGTRAGARRSRPTTRTARCRTGSPRRRPRRPGRGPASSASVAGTRSSGTVFAWSTARSCSGWTPTIVASDSSPSAKTTSTRLAPDDHVEVGQDDALVDDDDSGADVVPRLLLRALVVLPPAHLDDGGPDRPRRPSPRGRAGTWSSACAAPPRRCPAG